jgi:hypothetical protein
MIMKIAQIYFKTAVVLLVVSIVAGIVMSIGGDHRTAGAHAHLSLLGFVTTAVYGGYFALNEAKAVGRLPIVIWGVHTLGATVQFIALWMVLTGNPALASLLAPASIAILIGAVLFSYVVWRPATTALGVTHATA